MGVQTVHVAMHVSIFAPVLIAAMTDGNLFPQRNPLKPGKTS